MDISSLSSAVSAVKLAKDIAATALAVRDFNAVAGIVSGVNDQLLKAQEALFMHNMQLMEAQQQLFTAQAEIRDFKAAQEEREKYVLHEISDQTYVYRYRLPQFSIVTKGEPEIPLHHLCQPCFDIGKKSVLQRATHLGTVTLDCSLCKAEIDTGKTVPYSF